MAEKGGLKPGKKDLAQNINRPQTAKQRLIEHPLSDSDAGGDAGKDHSHSSQIFSPLVRGSPEDYDEDIDISLGRTIGASKLPLKDAQFRANHGKIYANVEDELEMEEEDDEEVPEKSDLRRYEEYDQSPNRDEFGQSFNDNSYNREFVRNEDIPRALKYLRATEFSENGWNEDDLSMNYVSEKRLGTGNNSKLEGKKGSVKDSKNPAEKESARRIKQEAAYYFEEYDGEPIRDEDQAQAYPHAVAAGKGERPSDYDDEEDFDDQAKRAYYLQALQELNKRQEELETVAERSVESEMTYKASMLDYEGNRTSTKDRVQRPFDSELFQSAEKREDKRYNYLISSLEFSKESLRDVKSAMNSSDKKRPFLSNTFGGKQAMSHGLYRNEEVPERGGGGSHYEQGLEVIDESRERRPISDQHRLLRGSKYENSAGQAESERSSNSYKKTQQTNFEGVKKVNSFGINANNVGSPFSNELSGTPPETDLKARDELEKYLTRSLTTSEKKIQGKELGSVKKSEPKEQNINNPNDSGNLEYYKQSNEKSFNHEKKQLNISELDVKLFSNDRNSYNFSSPHGIAGAAGNAGGLGNSEARGGQQERQQLFRITGFKGGSGTQNQMISQEPKDEIYEAMEREITTLKEEVQAHKRKILSQEDAIDKLKTIQNELHAAFSNSQQELQVVRAQKEKFESEKQQHVLQLNSKLASLEENLERTSRKLQEKDSVVKKLERDSNELSQEKSSFQKRNDILSKRAQELEAELADASERAKAYEKEIAKQKMMYKEQEGKLKALKDLESLKKERDQLADRLDTVLSENQEKDRSFKMKLDESMIEQKKKYEEKLNKMLTEAHYKYHTKQRKQAEQIDQLKNEVMGLKAELQRRPTPNQTAESERRIATLEKELDDVRQSAALNFQKSPKAEAYKHLVHELVDELKLGSITELPDRIRDLNSNYKTVNKFKERFLDMVMSCHPEGTFSGQRISLKQAWKWIKTVMEEYMKLRSQTLRNLNRVMTSEDSRIHEGIIQSLMELLGVRSREHVLRNVELLLQQYDDVARILDKMKRVLKIDNIRDLRELERVIDTKFVPKLESINRAKVH